MGLLLPASVVRDVRGERMREIEMAHRTDVCARFTKDLALIEPGLELVWWPQHASAPGFVPGRYHIIWHNPNGLGSVEPVVDEFGGYREPDSGLFELVRRSDMWDDRVVRDRKRITQAALDAKARAQQREREEIDEEVYERFKAATQTSVSMNRDTPWSQNAAGRRGAKR